MSAITPLCSALAGVRRGSAPPASLPMGAPFFLVLGGGGEIDLETTSGATITSQSVSPPANCDIIVVVYGRGSASRTHDSVTAGFGTVAGFVKLTERDVEDGPGVFHRLSLWRARTTASPGSGTIAASASGSNFQRVLGGVGVENVGSLVASGSNSSTAGTGILFTFSPGAASGDVAIVATVTRGGNKGSFSFTDGLSHADNSPFAQSSNFVFGMGFKVSPSSVQETTGLANNQAHLTVGALLREAA